MDKCRTTLRQFVRDWSAEGVVERETSYAPMIQALERYFSDLDVDERGSIYVLVPGAGLGRLAYDVAKRGFSCQGNEFSFFMLLASNFVLNKCSEAEQFTIYPWIHSLSNCLKPEDVLRGVSVPDVLPGDLLETVDFSMAAGDFVEVYGSPAQAGKWDCVMTCFFLDTAKNVVEYVEIINKCLVQGGLWINLGPLLYHFEGMVNEPSIELSYEDLLRVVDAYGFSILEEKGIDTTYSNNLRSMMTFTYHARFFVARKQPGT
ncbi:N2227-like protein [Hyaloraphidium curvatum]|nr:N2227-like protein [Hyaloraphidium curvatum]